MFYKKGKLPLHRITLLEELGFEWIRPHRSQTQFSKKATVAVPLVADEPDEDALSFHSTEQDHEPLPSRVIEEEAILASSASGAVDMSVRSPVDPYNVIAFV